MRTKSSDVLKNNYFANNLDKLMEYSLVESDGHTNNTFIWTLRKIIEDKKLNLSPSYS